MATTAFVFPGQGSQSVGMLGDLANDKIVVECFDLASNVLGYDLKDLIQNGPKESLDQTQITQPALLVTSVAYYRLIQHHFKQKEVAFAPTYLAGHSLGEYSALVCANSISLADGVRLVRDRGQFMQDAVPLGQGAMSAILGLDNDKIFEACVEAAQGQVVSPVNFNAIGQTVIAGNREAVERASVLVKAMGAKIVMPLPVSIPSHCKLMEPAAIRLKETLSQIEFKAPSIPVIHNVDVSLHTSPDAIKRVLVDQLSHPVRWVETVQSLVEKGVTTQYECGPGKVLTGLVKRIDKNLQAVSLHDKAAIDAYMA